MNLSLRNASRLVAVAGLITLLPPAHAHPAPPLDPIKLAEDNRDVDAAALKTGARAANPELRAATAIAFGRILKPAGLDPLLALTGDPDSSVKRAAIFALGQFGWAIETANGRETEISDRLVPFTRANAAPYRRLAIEAIGKLFHPGTQDFLVTLLADGDSGVREQALAALAQMRGAAQMRGETAKLAPLSDAALATVETLLKSDRTVAVRTNAAYLLYRLKDKRTNAAMFAATADRAPYVRMYAIESLARTGEVANESYYATILRLASDPAYGVRTENLTAAQKLGWIARLARETGRTIARDPYAHVRTAFVNALGGEPTITNADVAAFAHDRSRMVRAAVVTQLATREKTKALPLLAAALKDPDTWVRQTSVGASAALGADREAFLMESLRNSEVLVRSEAIQALGDLPSPTAQARVDEALKSDALSERLAAASAVSSRKDAGHLALLFATYENSLVDPKWWDLRGGLVDEFVKVNSAETSGYLRTVLHDPLPTLAYMAWRELTKRAEPNLPAMTAPELPRSADSLLRFTRNPKLRVETNRGTFRIELYPTAAQIHVATVVGFALKGGYDGLPWHRIVSDFVVQGGDPDGTGYGSGPYPIRAEINPIRYRRGTLGMPRSTDWDTGGVQLFITHVPTPNLDGLYTVFGQVTRGLEVLDRLEPGDRMTKVSVEL